MKILEKYLGNKMTILNKIEIFLKEYERIQELSGLNEEDFLLVFQKNSIKYDDK